MDKKNMNVAAHKINMTMALERRFVPVEIIYYKKDMGVEVCACYSNADPSTTLAIKFVQLRCEARRIEKFMSECAIMKRVHHVHVIDAVTTFYTSRVGAIVMEWVPFTVASLKKVHRVFPRAFAVSITHQILVGLAYLHSQGITHHDICANNVGVSRCGVAKILDFDLACACEADTRACRTTRGTPFYMAPEVMEKKPHDERVDIWGCGVLLHVMTTGALPFDASTFDVLARLVTSYDPSGFRIDSEQDVSLFDAFALMCSPPHIRWTAATMLEHALFSCSDPVYEPPPVPMLLPTVIVL